VTGHGQVGWASGVAVLCIEQAIAGCAAPRAGSANGPLVRSTARPDTGSVARLPLPNTTNGVDPEAFDQSLPFQSHVAALGATMVPQSGGVIGIGFAGIGFPPVPVALGAGVPAVSALIGGIKIVPELEPEEPEDEEPEPPEQAIGPWFDPATC
jgi:hypothetical protein